MAQKKTTAVNFSFEDESNDDGDDDDVGKTELRKIGKTPSQRLWHFSGPGKPFLIDLPIIFSFNQPTSWTCIACHGQSQSLMT